MATTPKVTEARDAAIGARIRLRRRALGITQNDLAAELGVTFQQVQKYEKGTNRVAASRLPVLADRLECSVGYLLGEPESGGGMPDDAMVVWLAEKGALALLEAYASITSPAGRRAALNVVKALSAAQQRE